MSASRCPSSYSPLSSALSSSVSDVKYFGLPRIGYPPNLRRFCALHFVLSRVKEEKNNYQSPTVPPRGQYGDSRIFVHLFFFFTKFGEYQLGPTHCARDALGTCSHAAQSLKKSVSKYCRAFRVFKGWERKRHRKT